MALGEVFFLSCFDFLMGCLLCSVSLSSSSASLGFSHFESFLCIFFFLSFLICQMCDLESSSVIIFPYYCAVFLEFFLNFLSTYLVIFWLKSFFKS